MLPIGWGVGMEAVEWTTELLDQLRQQGDEHADKVAQRYYAAIGGTPSRLFRGIVHGAEDDAEAAHVLADYYAEAAALPDWADPEQLARGGAFFGEWGLEIGLGLFCFGLPIGYAADRTAHVLDLTARLETSAHRRVFETAQMVLDVTAPDALQPGRQGHATARRVRLMHAGIRQLVTHDPRIARVPAPLADDVHFWCTDWGTPLSQEHLVGALLTFGYSMLHVLDQLELAYDTDDAEAYLHLWSVVGHLLGVRPDLLPIDRALSAHIEPILRKRNVRETTAGKRLTTALVDVLHRCGPDGMLGPLPVATMRMMLGDDIASKLGLPEANWAEHLLHDLGPVAHFLSLAELHDPAMRAVARALSRAIMDGFVRAERSGGRPAFAIPDHLSDVMGLPTT
jgi:hypothetical protein